MDQLGQALDLISRYGLALVGVVVLAIVVIWLFKALRDSWAAQLEAERAKTAYIEQLRLEERAGRLDSEARVASNSEALRQATNVFEKQSDALRQAQAFQQQLVERLVEQSGTGAAGGRRRD